MMMMMMMYSMLVVDINECKCSPYPCINHTVCTNNDGSYDCQCADGFSGNPYVECIGMYRPIGL